MSLYTHCSNPASVPMPVKATYPVILIPAQLQSARQAQPHQIKPYSEKQPELPEKTHKDIRQTQVATQSAIAILPSTLTIATPKIRPWGIGFTVIMLIAIATRTMRQWMGGQQYRQAKARYHSDMSQYQDAKRQYEREAVATFQMKLILEALQRTQQPDGDESRAACGVSEANFEEVLQQYFPGKIQTKHTLDIPNFPYPYSPDFTYVDSQHNFYIDIELDEPYRLKDYAPTHYLKCSKEAKRNRFFLNKGWLVIRFSEEQVVRWPDRCCKTIAEGVAQLLGNEVESKFQSIEDLPPQPRWTKEEAIALASQSIRDEYRAA